MRNLKPPYLRNNGFWAYGSDTSFTLLWKTFQMVQLVYKNFKFFLVIMETNYMTSRNRGGVTNLTTMIFFISVI